MNARFHLVRSLERSIRRRTAFTLTEMLVSIVTFAVLMTGLVSVLMVATQTLKLTEGPSARTSEGMRLLSKINGELVLAKDFVVRTSTAIEFTTHDRDGDSVDEIIRFDYLAAPENKITKTTYYTSTARTVVETLGTDVAGFDLQYLVASDPVEPALQDRVGEEKLLFARDLPLDDLTASQSDEPEPSDSPDTNPASPPAMGPSEGTFNLGKTVLLVVPDTGQLSAHESKLKAKMESLGTSVRLIGDSASQSEFDSELGICDLVYVPQSINAALFAGKIRNTALGVMSESVELAELIGMGQASSRTLSGPFINCGHDSTALVAGEVAGAMKLCDAGFEIKSLEGDDQFHSEHLRIVSGDSENVTMAYFEQGDKEFLDQNSPVRNLGYPQELVNASATYSWHHVGTKASLSEEFSANSISVFNNRLIASVLRFGIYTDNGGKPGSLLAETEIFAQSSNSSGSWTTLQLSESVMLDPGDYWVVASVFGAVKFYYESGGASQVCNSDQAVFSGMMPSWGTVGDVAYSAKLSMYVSGNVASYAAGRRLLVPWSGSGVDLNELSETGVNVFQKSLQWSATPKNSLDESNQDIRDSKWISQYFLPSFEVTESKWLISRISIYLQPLHSDASGNVRVSIYPADDSFAPTGAAIARSDWVSVSSFAGDHFRWWTVPINQISEVATSTGLCLVVETDSTTAGVRLGIDQNVAQASAKLFSSTDQGATWNLSEDGENMRFYIFGKTVTNE